MLRAVNLPVEGRKVFMKPEGLGVSFSVSFLLVKDSPSRFFLA